MRFYRGGDYLIDVEKVDGIEFAGIDSRVCLSGITFRVSESEAHEIGRAMTSYKEQKEQRLETLCVTSIGYISGRLDKICKFLEFNKNFEG